MKHLGFVGKDDSLQASPVEASSSAGSQALAKQRFAKDDAEGTWLLQVDTRQRPNETDPEEDSGGSGGLLKDPKSLSRKSRKLTTLGEP